MNFKRHQLFFDLDRTLWDFEANSQKALSILYKELNMKEFTSHFIQFHQAYKKHNAILWDKYAKKEISREQLRIQRFIDTLADLGNNDLELAKQLCEGYIDISPNQTLLFPNTIEALEELKNLGYAMSIITNGFKEVQHRKLQNSKLSDFFDHVICSEEVGHNKPDKRVYEHALNLAQAQNTNSVMIGDDLRADVIGAETAGITGILFDENKNNQYVKDIQRIKNLNELPLLLLKIRS